MNQQITNTIDKLEQSFDAISDERKQLLKMCASSIAEQLRSKQSSDVIVICTHNSRRSQLAELWISMASQHFGIAGINSFSGGSEATAFNHRMVNALLRMGIQFQLLEAGENPVYAVDIDQSDSQKMISHSQKNQKQKQYFSKQYSHQYNPQSGFIAVLVCHSADTACPTVIGAAHRYFIPFVDPKHADDSADEAAVYDDKVLEVGREMIYMIKMVKEGHKERSPLPQ